MLKVAKEGVFVFFLILEEEAFNFLPPSILSVGSNSYLSRMWSFLVEYGPNVSLKCFIQVFGLWWNVIGTLVVYIV